MGVITIACYRPKAGKQAELEALMLEHVPILRGQGLVTERTPIAMRSKDGTVVEVFEWLSQAAIDSAHTNPEVLKLWERYGAVCDYVRLPELAEGADLFAGFTALD
jgi:hypothetical protein